MALAEITIIIIMYSTVLRSFIINLTLLFLFNVVIAAHVPIKDSDTPITNYYNQPMQSSQPTPQDMFQQNKLAMPQNTVFQPNRPPTSIMNPETQNDDAKYDELLDTQKQIKQTAEETRRISRSVQVIAIITIISLFVGVLAQIGATDKVYQKLSGGVSMMQNQPPQSRPIRHYD